MSTSKALATFAIMMSSLAATAADMDILFLPGGKTMAVPGFRMYIASGYTPSEKNIEFLKGLKEKVSTPHLFTFDANKNNSNMLLCRGSFPVYGPNKTPFASLVEAAVNMELVAAGLATPDAPKVNATLDEFDFSSSIFSGGKWIIDATFLAEGRAPLVVKSVHSYPVSAGAVAGCNEVMVAMPIGVEAFLMKLYSDPAFVDVLR